MMFISHSIRFQGSFSSHFTVLQHFVLFCHMKFTEVYRLNVRKCVKSSWALILSPSTVTVPDLVLTAVEQRCSLCDPSWHPDCRSWPRPGRRIIIAVRFSDDASVAGLTDSFATCSDMKVTGAANYFMSAWHFCHLSVFSTFTPGRCCQSPGSPREWSLPPTHPPLHGSFGQSVCEAEMENFFISADSLRFLWPCNSFTISELAELNVRCGFFFIVTNGSALWP